MRCGLTGSNMANAPWSARAGGEAWYYKYIIINSSGKVVAFTAAEAGRLALHDERATVLGPRAKSLLHASSSRCVRGRKQGDGALARRRRRLDERAPRRASAPSPAVSGSDRVASIFIRSFSPSPLGKK